MGEKVTKYISMRIKSVIYTDGTTKVLRRDNFDLTFAVIDIC